MSGERWTVYRHGGGRYVSHEQIEVMPVAEHEAEVARLRAVMHNPSNPDQAGDWYANQPPGPDPLHEACERRGGVCDCAGRPCGLDGRRVMLTITAAQIRYALDSDELTPATRTTLTIAQNALKRVCRRCGGERWEDAEDGGRCVNCGTPHHDLDGEFGDMNDDLDAGSPVVSGGSSAARWRG